MLELGQGSELGLLGWENWSLSKGRVQEWDRIRAGVKTGKIRKDSYRYDRSRTERDRQIWHIHCDRVRSKGAHE